MDASLVDLLERAKVNRCKFWGEFSSTLVNFDMQICTTDKWQTVMMVLTFKGKGLPENLK